MMRTLAEIIDMVKSGEKPEYDELRYAINENDYRPINWPVKHPYWCTGYGDGFSVVVAYADDEAEILRNWPEAEDIDTEKVNKYFFSSRFPKPDWLEKVKND